MQKLRLAAFLPGLLLSIFGTTGCATPPTPIQKALAATQPDYCATAKPIYIAKEDVFTDATAREILEHNETGRNLCGWGKKEKK